MTTSTLNATRKTHLSTIVASPDSLFRQRVVQQLAARNCFAEEACGGAEALALIEEGDLPNSAARSIPAGLGCGRACRHDPRPPPAG